MGPILTPMTDPLSVNRMKTEVSLAFQRLKKAGLAVLVHHLNVIKDEVASADQCLAEIDAMSETLNNYHLSCHPESDDRVDTKEQKARQKACVSGHTSINGVVLCLPV
jgi:hypothetical protein